MTICLRILVVDDRPDAADSLAMVLTCAGHKVEVAYDGEACLAKASSTFFDAVLLIAKQIRNGSACQDSFLIAITGYADEANRQHSVQAGFDKYLAKPVDPRDLILNLSQWSAAPSAAIEVRHAAIDRDIRSSR